MYIHTRAAGAQDKEHRSRSRSRKDVAIVEARTRKAH